MFKDLQKKKKKTHLSFLAFWPETSVNTLSIQVQGLLTLSFDIKWKKFEKTQRKRAETQTLTYLLTALKPFFIDVPKVTLFELFAISSVEI